MSTVAIGRPLPATLVQVSFVTSLGGKCVSKDRKTIFT